MGKRKSSKPVEKRERPKLETIFPCPLCGGHNTVTCSFDRPKQLATVTCVECQSRYQVDDVTILDEPVDIYARWIDACEAANA
jgi:transcription elongation factor Elf1